MDGPTEPGEDDSDNAPRVDYYHQDRYWNDLARVVDHQRTRLPFGDGQWLHGYVMEQYCDPPRKRALVIGCGNGWVERELADLGVAAEFDAFDFDPAYIRQCEAARGDRPINYFVADFAGFEPSHRYDLIVNFAALHHAARLHRMCHRLASALTDDGIFVNWDYVGPDRNQYSDIHVRRLHEVNNAMPERFRTTHLEFRPSLYHMVAADPTEAVHSSEIVSAVSAHFEILEHHDIGGALAYPILWNNIDEFEHGDEEADEVLDRLLALDAAATDDGSLPVLFSFFVARSRRGPTPARATVERRLREPLREWAAGHTRQLYPSQLASIVRRHRLWDPRVAWRHRQDLR